MVSRIWKWLEAVIRFFRAVQSELASPPRRSQVSAPSSWTAVPPPAPSAEERAYLDQLAILDITFPGAIRPAKILETGECPSFYAALDALEALKPATRHWHVHAQVSMGEFLETSFDKARPVFNSKRVDLLICDRFGKPVLVVEHQGSDHIRPNTRREDELRNQVKHTVLKKAGIPMLETPAGIDRDAARALIVAELQTFIATWRAR